MLKAHRNLRSNITLKNENQGNKSIFSVTGEESAFILCMKKLNFSYFSMNHLIHGQFPMRQERNRKGK